MNELHLFAGAGGGILAGQLLGHRCIGAVEINPYCQRVLQARQSDGSLPPFPVFSDIRRFDARPYRGKADIVAGGFPCQVNSSASRGRRVAEDLWPEFLRVVADAAPWIVFAENVTRKAIDAAAEDLESLGYSVKCVELSAADMGADHVRSRYWLLAHADMHGELQRAVNAEMGVRSRIRPRVWDTYADEPRMDDGLAHRLDRIKSAGNGQVSIVAATAWRLLMDAHGITPTAPTQTTHTKE